MSDKVFVKIVPRNENGHVVLQYFLPFNQRYIIFLTLRINKVMSSDQDFIKARENVFNNIVKSFKKL